MNVCKGLFITDKDAPLRKRAGQLISRFLWELPNTVSGFVVSLAATLLYKTEVRFHHGSTFIKVMKKQSKKRPHAFTLGSYIVGTHHSDRLLHHEYGHTIQSRIFGPLYLVVIALPSIVSAALSSNGKHNTRWYEKDANKRGARFEVRQELRSGGNAIMR